MSSLAAQVLADLDHEFTNTRRMLERVPVDHLQYTPHAKSWPVGKLALHLAEMGDFGAITLETPEIDFTQPMPRPAMPSDAAGFVAVFDAGLARFRSALARASDADLLAPWTMRSGATVISALPRITVLRGMVMNHMIHHRAQLTMYYRMLDVPVPGLYGPSADER